MASVKNLIIGGGISAHLVAYNLTQKGESDITMIYNHDFIPSCSLNSTSIVSLRGTQRGLSPLGDLIVDSYEEFVRFVSLHKPKGVERGIEYQLWSHEDHEKFSRRYKEYSKASIVPHTQKNCDLFLVENEAYFVSPSLFISELQSLHNAKHFNHLVDFVDKENKYVQTNNNDMIHFDKLYICVSNFSKHFLEVFEGHCDRDKIAKSKEVAGNYLEFDASSFGDLDLSSSFSLAYRGSHLIFRNEEAKIIVGSTSKNTSVYQSHPDIVENVQSISELIGRDIKITNSTSKVGIRHKASKRMPLWGCINDDISYLCATYKNGYNFPFLLAKRIIT